MKRIIAMGGGYDGQDKDGNLIAYIASSCGKKNPKVVILPTTKNDVYDEETHPDAIDFRKAGCSVKVLRLTKHRKGSKIIEKTILGADVIYVPGGNLALTMKIWHEKGADDLLRQAYENGVVLSGSSAGAMSWFARGYDNCGAGRTYMFVDCLGLIPYCFCPHFESGTWYTFGENIKQQLIPGLAAEDGAAVEFADGQYRIVTEKDGRCAYLFDPEKGFEKQKVEGDALILNERASRE